MTRYLAICMVLALGFSACGFEPPSGPSTNSNTNWLTACDEDIECGTDGACLCGYCTATCALADDCGASRPGAVCAPTNEEPVSTLCGGDPPTTEAICLPGCQTSGDCGDDFVCSAGGCVPASGEDPSSSCGVEGEFVCGEAFGADPQTLYACRGGAYIEAEQCGFACVSLIEEPAVCAPDRCPQGDGNYCGSELGLPDGFLYRCAGVSIDVSSCAACTPGRGAATCP